MTSVKIEGKVLRAIANRDRRIILEVLRRKRACNYVELMKASGFTLGESGRFSYHLKRLIETDLVKKLPDGRYTLTNVGIRVVDILREEERPYNILDLIEEFLKNIDEEKFFMGSALIVLALFAIIIGVTNFFLLIFNAPLTIRIGTQTYYKTPNPALTIIYIMMGTLVLFLALTMLRKSALHLSLLELLIHQRYTFFLLSRSKNLRKYAILYILIIISCLFMVIIQVLL